MADHETDKNIEFWKIKKLIKALEAARGNVTSAQQRLKLYNRVPPNGLVLYTGTVVTDDGKEKKVTMDFEPFKPINASLYLCDNKFHTEPLNELLESDDSFGFIVMDGNGTLFGTLSGNTREVLHKFTVDLPKKHGRGGQSALRFARLRMGDEPAQCVGTHTGVAGSADFKTELSQSDMFDPRLQAKILNVVDVSYGGENGFNQAIELSSEILSNVKFIQEKRLIGKYFEEISQDSGKYIFGVDDTIKVLEMGAVETLITCVGESGHDEIYIEEYRYWEGNENERTAAYGVQWQTDTSAVAAHQTIQEQINVVTASMVILSASEEKKACPEAVKESYDNDVVEEEFVAMWKNVKPFVE
ncbi:hypothetical protein ACS0TY_016414 [Phlomoides rotata]